MAENAKLNVIIDAEDNASPELKKFDKNLGQVEGSSLTLGKTLGAMATTVAAVGAALTAGYVAMQPFIKASNELNNALLGLSSVARAFKQDVDKTKKAAQELAKDGLMSVKDAADGLKNLLGAGFNLDQATKLMNAFKDSAAFNRQGMLGFGEAIVGATQGIKNQNSIMVDNAGITKNLSIILKEAGYSAQDLGLVTSDVGVRMALFNGILKESSAFQGDAGLMADTLTGKQAQLSTAFFNLKALIGDQLAPVMGLFLDQGMRVTAMLTELASSVQAAGGIVAFFQETFRAVMAFLEEKLGLITILKTSFDSVATVFREKLYPELQKLWVALQPLMPFIQKLAEVFGVVLYGALILVVKLLEVSLIILVNMLTAAVKIANGVIETFANLWNGFIDIISRVITKFDELIDRIKQVNILGGAKSMISNALGFGGGKAAGGPVKSGTGYMVGENGPEFFTPGQSGTIIPNHKLGGGGTTINITVNGDVTGEDLIDRVGDALTQKLKLSSAIVG